MKLVSLLLPLTVAVALLTGCSASSRKAANCPATKAIVRQVSENSAKSEVTITDGETLAKLLDFLGDIENEEPTQINGKWKEKYRIAFIMKSGMHIIIITSEDDTTWTSGSGDKQMATGISSVLAPLFGGAAASTEGADAGDGSVFDDAAAE